MDYSDFLFSQLFMNHCETNATKYKDLTYDVIYPEIIRHQQIFLESDFNTASFSEYDCICNYLNQNVKELYKVDKSEFLKWYFEDQEKDFLKRTCFDLAKGNITAENLFFDCGYIPSRLIINYQGEEKEFCPSDCELK